MVIDSRKLRYLPIPWRLGVNINSNNNRHDEINDRIACGNRCYYYSIMKLLKSKTTITQVKGTIVPQLFTTNSHIRERNLVTDHRRWPPSTYYYLRKIGAEKYLYGPRYTHGVASIREKKKSSLTGAISQAKYYIMYKMQMPGHVWGADGQVMKEVLVNKINKKRPIVRLRTRWVDFVVQDIKKRTRSLTTLMTERSGEVLWWQRWPLMGRQAEEEEEEDV